MSSENFEVSNGVRFWRVDTTKDIMCDALRNLVPLYNLKKREKHSWRCVNFSKVAGFSLQLY